MRISIYPLFITLLVIIFSLNNLEAQNDKLRGKKGDICFAQEYAWWASPAQADFSIKANLHNDYLDCVAQVYFSANLSLYDVTMRVGHTDMVNALSAIAWIHCANSQEDGCTVNYMKYLIELDSDKDGLEDVYDPTPYGGTSTPNTNSTNNDDLDGDGIVNAKDACPDTPKGSQVNSRGCSKLLLQAESLIPFYVVTSEYIYILGRVLEPNGQKGVAGAKVSLHYDRAIISIITNPDGYFFIDELLQSPIPQTYSLLIEAEHPDFLKSQKTVTFSVRPHLGIEIHSDQSEYYANQTIHLSGKVYSPEPIGSDLDIQCEIKVFDQPILEPNQPYRIQRVPLRSDGSFSYDVQIYGPDQQGKWLESGEYGNWMVTAEVTKEFEMANDGLFIDVYKNHVARDKENRRIWNEIHKEKLVQTQQAPHAYQRTSHNEAFVLGPETKAILQKTSKTENRIKAIDGAILYLKDMRHSLTQNNPLPSNGDAYIFIEGIYIDCSSLNSSYILEVDPVSKIDKVTVFDGPINIKSKNGKFSNLQLKSGSQLFVNQTGVLDQRSLSRKELRNAGQAFAEVLGGINPVEIGHQTDKTIEEMHSPESQPSFEEIIEDNYLYIIAGVISLGIILLMIRKFGIGITKPMVTSERPKKDSSEDGWETAGFCSQCNQAIPPRSKFCPSCGAKQS